MREKLIKANKKRRQKLFRNWFIKNKNNYGFTNLNNCLIGQLMRFALGLATLPEYTTQTAQFRDMKTVIDFYGLKMSPKRLYDIYVGNSGWVEVDTPGLGFHYHRALATLDQTVFAG